MSHSAIKDIFRRLPGCYQDFDEYFRDVMLFLCDYQWIYRYPMTGLLIHNVLSQIPAEWQDFFKSMSSSELTMLSNRCLETQVLWPHSLVQFLEKCKHLQLKCKVITDDWHLSRELRRGLSVKKQHEVSRMTSLVHKECKKLGIRKILDVGSGLGYMGCALHLDLGYHVLGLEANEAYVTTATEKLFSLCDGCKAISFHTYDVSRSTFPDICCLMEKRFYASTCSCSGKQSDEISRKIQGNQGNSGDICLIGLHTCGDLSSIAVDFFLATSELQLMVLVPCCYHRITVCNANPEREDCNYFSTFPVSEKLTNVLKKEFEGFEEYLGRPFLRLASQESSCRWQHWTEKQHQQHSENLMARGVLDLAVAKMGLSLRKKHRRCVRKSQRDTFETFLEDAMARYDFVSPNGIVVNIENQREIIEQARILWLQNKNLCFLAEALTGLQGAMQASVESFIIADKIACMLERQSELCVDVVKLMDEELSPRCRALVVKKIR